jgi:hypothetical protein
MSTLKTPEGVSLHVTGRSPELFLRIVTPSGLEFGWPVTKGTIGAAQKKGRHDGRPSISAAGDLARDESG